MRKNRIREIWASGKAAVNGWLSVPSPYVAEIWNTVSSLPIAAMALIAMFYCVNMDITN